MLKTSGATIASILLLAGCAGDINKVTLENGQTATKMDIQTIDDKDNYLSEKRLMSMHVGTTLGSMTTTSSSKRFSVRLERFAPNRKSRFSLYPFSINTIKPTSCKEGKVSKSRKFQECTFDKQRVYSSYVKINRLLVDESGNGKLSASWGCLKQYPRTSGKSMYESAKWSTTVDSCIAKQYKMDSWNMLTGGTLESRLSHKQLAYTNKHYEFRMGEESGKFKQFLFGK